MYKIMKTLITKKYYKTGEEAQSKLDVFFAVSRITEEEYVELTNLVQQLYYSQPEESDEPEEEYTEE